MIRSMVVVLAVLCLVFVGCGDKKEDDTGKNGVVQPDGGGNGGGNGGSDEGGGGAANVFAKSAAGTYELNLEQMTPLFEQMAVEQAKESMPEMPEGVAGEEALEGAIKMAKSMAKAMLTQMKFEIILNADGTFNVEGTNPNGGMEAEGTWRQDGSDIWFKTTKEDGVAKDELEKPGKIKDGNIHFKPEDDMPFELIFKRK